MEISLDSTSDNDKAAALAEASRGAYSFEPELTGKTPRRMRWCGSFNQLLFFCVPALLILAACYGLYPSIRLATLPEAEFITIQAKVVTVEISNNPKRTENTLTLDYGLDGVPYRVRLGVKGDPRRVLNQSVPIRVHPSWPAHPRTNDLGQESAINQALFEGSFLLAGCCVAFLVLWTAVSNSRVRRRLVQDGKPVAATVLSKSLRGSGLSRTCEVEFSYIAPGTLAETVAKQYVGAKVEDQFSVGKEFTVLCDPSNSSECTVYCGCDWVVVT